MIPKFRKAGFEVVVLIFALLNSIPLYIVAINTFKSGDQIVRHPLAFPDFSVGIDNIVRAFTRMELLTSYAVTISIGALSIGYTIFFSSMAAYSLARIRHWFFKSTYWVYLSCILLPIQAAFIPLIFILKDMHLHNTIFGISLVYIAITSPFSIFMFTGFIRGVPPELDESAKIDGSSAFRTFFSIVFPLLKPVSATLFIFQFVHIWDDLLLPLVLLNSNDYPTVTLGLYKFFSDHGLTDLSLVFGGFFLVLLPMLILFVFFQRFFIKGLHAGSIKG